MLSRLLRNMTFQVLVAIALGVVVGLLAPGTAKALKPLGDTFVNLVKMVIGPIVFLTIVLGIANMGDLKKIGKVGGKALLYFEIVTTMALGIGLVVVNVLRPGEGLDASKLLPREAMAKVASGEKPGLVDFLTHIVPSNMMDAFAKGDILQVVFIAVLFGIAMTRMGQVAKPLAEVLDKLAHVFFRIVGIVMHLAPLGAFGAMAFTVGNFGLATLLPLGKLMLCVYTTMFLFVFGVLGVIARLYGFGLWSYLRFIKDEIVLVLGTSSSEPALPRMISKLERYGCAPPVVGLVIPAGYSFNLDGTSIYLSMAALFLAQVYKVDLSVGQQLTILAILMITSKGAAGVTGSGFIVLASTLAAMKTLPVEGVALLLGVDRFMSEARAIVNVIGNGVATIVVAKSERAFDEAQNRRALEEAGILPALAPASHVGAAGAGGTTGSSIP